MLITATDDPEETEYYILGGEYGRQRVWFELNEAETRLYNGALGL